METQIPSWVLSSLHRKWFRRLKKVVLQKSKRLGWSFFCRKEEFLRFTQKKPQPRHSDFCKTSFFNRWNHFWWSEDSTHDGNCFPNAALAYFLLGVPISPWCSRISVLLFSQSAVFLLICRPGHLFFFAFSFWLIVRLLVPTCRRSFSTCDCNSKVKFGFGGGVTGPDEGKIGNYLPSGPAKEYAGARPQKTKQKKRARQSISNIYMRFYEIPRAGLPRPPIEPTWYFF